MTATSKTTLSHGPEAGPSDFVRPEARRPSFQGRKLGLKENINTTGVELSSKVMGAAGWYLATDVRARPFANFRDQGELLERWGPVAIFRLKPGQEESAFAQEEWPVVYRPDRRISGILMGRVILQLKNMESADALLNEYGLQVEMRKDSLGYVIARTADPASVLQLTTRLVADPRVHDARVEIINRSLVGK